jgi:hypothetical protein
MNFETQIQEWVTVDNKIKLYNEQLNILRKQRTELEQNITNYASKNNLYDSVIQISDGKLTFINSKVTPPLTFKYLENSLGEVIKNNEQVKIIMNHLKKNREIKNTQEIKRYYYN